jgi:hypothetical protein
MTTKLTGLTSFQVSELIIIGDHAGVWSNTASTFTINLDRATLRTLVVTQFENQIGDRGRRQALAAILRNIDGTKGGRKGG